MLQAFQIAFRCQMDRYFHIYYSYLLAYFPQLNCEHLQGTTMPDLAPYLQHLAQSRQHRCGKVFKNTLIHELTMD